ncbi:MAG: hypothetical protein ACFB02_19790 [Mastigocoleus sp.]
MDNQFTVSFFEHTAQTNLSSEAKYPITIIVDFGHPVSADYIKRLASRGCLIQDFSDAEKLANTSSQVTDMTVFIHGKLPEKTDTILELVKRYRVKNISIITTFQSYFDNNFETIELEEIFLHRLKEVGSCGVIFCCGHIISDRSLTEKNLRRFAFASPLIPSSLRSCCISGEEVFEAIDAEQNSSSRRSRIITLLGANRPWQEFLKDYWSDNILQVLLRNFCFVLSFLLFGHLAAFLLNWLIKLGLISRCWSFDTLKPSSTRELLSLVNKYNLKYVKVVGYNNGVNHLGSRYPEKTVISTVNCDRIIRVSENIIKVDCGATILQTLDFLRPKQQELYAIPNYSHICMGTAFFVPIHGNALDYTTIAESIVKVVLYDPKEERFIITSRQETTFKQYIFNTTSQVILLRMYLEVKPKARYFPSKVKLSQPNSQVLLDAFCDNTISNIDIRKSKADSEIVYINKYYSKSQEKTKSEGLEFPRDSIGGLWDKLEEKPITSWLMHTPVRYLLWNIELFLTEEEFITFWETHSSLPIRKIEIRYVKRSSSANSPFPDCDCIAVDFMLSRKHCQVIKEYIKNNFAVPRYHLGKHY